jgi:hypothetical protein
MKLSQVFLTAALAVAAIGSAVASNSRDTVTRYYFTNPNNTGTVVPFESSVICSDGPQSCHEFIPALGQDRQLFKNSDGTGTLKLGN